MCTCSIRFIRTEMTSTEGNAQTYKMMSLDPDINQHFQDAIDVIQQHSHNTYNDSDCKYYETLGSQPSSLQVQMSCCFFAHQSDIPAAGYDWAETTQQSWPQVPDASLSHSVQNDMPHFYSIIAPQRNNKGRKKLRLYEYLHEALNDPSMGDSIQWTDSSNGTFHFISKNKEKLAECWGQRKGNRKTMTYQKMARALRNYSRTGEIVKVRRKLTYQFNPDILHRLGSTQVPMHLQRQPTNNEAHSRQESPSGHSYSGSAATDWHGWYGHYQLQEDYDLASSLTSQSSAKL